MVEGEEERENMVEEGEEKEGKGTWTQWVEYCRKPHGILREQDGKGESLFPSKRLSGTIARKEKYI
ncbi:hypothetical protein E2C01_090462 [Portunus trituberculatus]|uniref:Uncharacterized protein n=1 Tax=Portunus trituberculatus TaxID=210409 RepID=A0A5B7JES2_PORTR|nr:hypothetical protein [Portunus trituberculatus]